MKDDDGLDELPVVAARAEEQSSTRKIEKAAEKEEEELKLTKNRLQAVKGIMWFSIVALSILIISAAVCEIFSWQTTIPPIGISFFSAIVTTCLGTIIGSSLDHR